MVVKNHPNFLTTTTGSYSLQVITEVGSRDSSPLLALTFAGMAKIKKEILLTRHFRKTYVSLNHTWFSSISILQWLKNSQVTTYERSLLLAHFAAFPLSYCGQKLDNGEKNLTV